jgi:phosphoserine phosphatase RsbU/P
MEPMEPIEPIEPIARRLWLGWAAILAACALVATSGLGAYASRASDEALAPELALTTEVIAGALSVDLQRALSYGVPLREIPGMAEWFEDVVAANPVLVAVALSDATGMLLHEHRLPEPLRPILARRLAGGQETVERWQLSTVSLKASTDVAPAGWLHVVGARQAPTFDPLKVSFPAALIAALLVAMGLRALLRHRLAAPLRAVRETFAGLAQGQLPDLAPSPGAPGRHAPAERVRALLDARLDVFRERKQQLLRKLGEVRAAHFDPTILERIDALAKPLSTRGAQAAHRAQATTLARATRLPITPRMLLATAGAIALAVAAAWTIAALQAGPERRALVQSAEEALARGWASALNEDRRKLEAVLTSAASDAALASEIAEARHDLLVDTLKRMRSSGLTLSLVQQDGTALATTASRGMRPYPQRNVLKRLRGAGDTLHGVWQGADRTYQSGAARVVLGPRGEPLALVATWPLQRTLEALSSQLAAPASVADLRGQPVFEADKALVDAWRAAGREGHIGVLADAPVVIASRPLLSAGGLTLGTLLAATPRAAELTDREQLLRTLAWAVLLGAALAALLYLRATLVPVARSADRLQRLADDDASGEPEAAPPLSAGTMQHSIDRLRGSIEALSALKRSRDRQGRRQARFIRQQMLELASRLDEGARAHVLEDLRRIEEAGKAEPGSADTAGAGASAPAYVDPRFEQTVNEVGILALGFQNVVARVGDQYQELARYVDELREALRVKTQFIAIQQELEIARKMQLSFLPQEFGVHAELSLRATMNAAKEVGGDFYDFFAIDEHRVAVTVADVSGKGVPAAFFMAVSRTLLRAVARFCDGPAATLTRLNDLLEADNAEMMFVTLFYAVIDTRDGSVCYSNAGHNPPYVLRADGSIEALAPTGDMALGVMGGMDYSELGLVLAPGETLAMYTDGVTEACNPAEELFGEPRLETLLSDIGRLDVEEITLRIVAAVKAFEDGSPQTDDVTTLVVRLKTT